MKIIEKEDGTHIAIVQIIEYERGWGERLGGSWAVQGSFNEVKEWADKFIAEYNSRNTATSVPDIYWVAELVGIYPVSR